MAIGPLWTDSSLRKINGEDHLGIKNEAILMADRLQAGITSITPRARYWSFFAWVLHDFIEHSNDRNAEDFRFYLKRQEWYFILANLAETKQRGAPILQLMGVTAGEEAWNQAGDGISYRDNYLNAHLGGYNTYGNVMKTLGLTKEGDASIGVYIDRLTQKGKDLAEAFRDTISHTEYYIIWRWKCEPVPRNVLLEYGSVAGLGRLQGSYDLPRLQQLFLNDQSEHQSDQLRIQSMNYYQHIVQYSNGSLLNNRNFRMLMYDVFSPLGDRYQEVPENLEIVVRGWEIYQGRQLFTYSLESMWSFLLDLMSRRTLSLGELLGQIFQQLRLLQLPLDSRLEELLTKTPLSSGIREQYIDQMNKEASYEKNIWNPFLVMLDVFRRFNKRDDMVSIHKEFLASGKTEHLSILKWDIDVEKYSERPAVDLIAHILQHYILRQHQQVALNKLVTTRNETYHFTEDNGKLHFLGQDQAGFNTFRVNQGMSILEDLGYLKRDGDKWYIV